MRTNGFTWAGVEITVTEGQLSAPPSKGAGRGRDRFNNQNRTFGTQNGQNGHHTTQQNQQSRNSSLSSRITSGNNANNNNHNINNHQPQSQGRNQNRELFDAPKGPRGGGFQNNRHTNGRQSSPFNNAPAQSIIQNPSGSDLETSIAEVIRRRYNAGEKFLDLSALAADPDFQRLGISNSSAEKVFKVLFVVTEKLVFETKQKRMDMVESVSFKNNGIKNVKEILGASSTFYSIKNLDLSDNNIERIGELAPWKARFPKLEQIIISGNPVDSPNLRQELQKWYRNLKTYNMLPLQAPFDGAQQAMSTDTMTINDPSFTASLQQNIGVTGAGPNGEILNSAAHPEFADGAMFGLPEPGKPADQVIKEQLGLRLSYETGLKMKYVEEALVNCNFNLEQALIAFNDAMSNGNVPADAFLQT